MGIRIRLSKILGEERHTQSALAVATGIRPATISKLYHEEIKRIEIDQIDRICAALGCQPGDLFEFVPPSEAKVTPLPKKYR